MRLQPPTSSPGGGSCSQPTPLPQPSQPLPAGRALSSLHPETHITRPDAPSPQGSLPSPASQPADSQISHSDPPACGGDGVVLVHNSDGINRLSQRQALDAQPVSTPVGAAVSQPMAPHGSPPPTPAAQPQTPPAVAAGAEGSRPPRSSQEVTPLADEASCSNAGAFTSDNEDNGGQAPAPQRLGGAVERNNAGVYANEDNNEDDSSTQGLEGTNLSMCWRFVLLLASSSSSSFAQVCLA